MAGWMPKVLTADGLHHIATHKYKGGVYTPLDNLLNPWWLWLTGLLPTWVAPNLVTLSGFAPMAVGYVLAWYYSPDGASPLPRWLTGFQAGSLLFYQTMDAMDGKQARRIGLSTPMGQLFDHGFDCLGCISIHAMTWSVLAFQGSFWGLAALSALQFSFFMAQWQERYTGILQTACGPFGVTETQYSLIALAGTATIVGPERYRPFFTAAVNVPMIGEVPLGETVAYGWVIFNVVLEIISLLRTFPACFSGGTLVPDEEVPASQENPRGTGRFIRSLQDLFPMVVMVAVPLLWKPSIYAASPRLVSYAGSILGFHLTAKMILFTMARQAFPALQIELVPFVLLVVSSRFSPDAFDGQFLVVVRLFAAAATIGVVMWLLSAIQQLKTKLGIYILLTKKMVAEDKKAG